MERLLTAGDVISYRRMCDAEGINTLQRGMNYRLNGHRSVFLMSQRANAPYRDRIEDEGRTLIYEGHDVPRTASTPEPKRLDQPLATKTGRKTQNGLFFEAAETRGSCTDAELVRVYEKIMPGIWTYVGDFALVDAWQENDGNRLVCKFRLQLTDRSERDPADNPPAHKLDHQRLIPSEVKREVWTRDQGRCVECGAADNLHFDHVIPYSKGGSSLVAENIQLLCARHNLAKRDRIQ